MHLRLLLLVALAGTLVSTSHAARAPEWAQSVLAADAAAFAPRARAVRLADVGIVKFDDAGHVHRLLRSAVRILTQNGRSAAACSISYNADTEKLIDARAWLVSADGRHTESFSASDFTDAAFQDRGTFWPQRRILSLGVANRAEVGGAFVWEFEFESQVSIIDLTWYFPTERPTLFCSYDVNPPPGGRIVWHASNPSVPQPTPGEAPGALHWEERNFHPPMGGDRPTGFLPSVRCLAVRAIAGNGSGQDMSWGELAKFTDDLVQPRIAGATPALAAKAEALVAGQTDRWQRIRTIASFVQQEITYLEVTLDKDCLAGYRPHAAAEVFANRYGDCKDKATLLLALLRAIHEDGFPMLVFAGNPTAVQPDWPSPRFNHMIVAIPADGAPANWPVVDGGALGKVVLFDPTDQYTPLGVLPVHDQGGYGLIVSPHSTGLVQLPPSLDDIQSELNLTVDEYGGIASTYSETTSGAHAAAQHRQLEIEARSRFTKSLEERFHTSVSSLRDLHWDDTWEPVLGQWHLTCNFTAPAYATRSRDLMTINPHVLAWQHIGAWKTHVDGVAWHSGRKLHETVRLKLPPGCKVEETPDPWSGKASHVQGGITYRQEGDTIVCDIEGTVTAGFLDRAAYEATREFLLKLENAARRPVVLRLATIPR